MTVPDDDSLRLTAALNAAQAGEDAAFLTLYRELQPRLVRYLIGLVGGDAEDVASETWLQVTRDLRTFRGNWDGFRGWVTTVARNRAMDHLRHQRRRPALAAPAEEFLGLAGPDDTADRALELVATDEALALIAALPRDQAEVILLRVVVGLDAKTTGQVLGKRAGTVRMAAYRGLRRLAEQTAGRDGLRAPPSPTVTHFRTAALREVR
ncbi:MAG TPA: RNA polymerase sigma factor [Rugosimonospora sp.]|nr:RNA polymerase sigma factor [Rugosimonospora sp.]